MPKEGFLLKQGEKGLKSWKKRWFAIRTGNGVPGRRPHLYYYDKSNGETKEKGRIDLELAVDISTCTDAPKEFFEFAITTPKRKYRLRAASFDEMHDWIKELRSFGDSSLSSKVTVGSLTDSGHRPISMKPGMETEKVASTPPQRAMSVRDGFNVPTNPPNDIDGGRERSSTKRITSNSETVRSGIKEMRERALQKAESSEQPKSTDSLPHVYSSLNTFPVVEAPKETVVSNWTSQEDSKELQTARKRLGKAQKLNSKYEEDIRKLRETVNTLTQENNRLKEKIETRENTIDYDKKRREIELEEAQRKLANEKRLKEELSVQLEDVRNELKVLKQSIHISRTAPNIHALDKEADKPQTNVQSVVFTHPPLSDTHNRPRRSASLAEIRPTISPPKAGDTKGRTPWVPDESATKCLLCKTEFGLFTRKHHCRNCGLIFCAACSDRMCKVNGYPDPQRVCKKCFASIRAANRGKDKIKSALDSISQPIHQHNHIPPASSVPVTTLSLDDTDNIPVTTLDI